MAQFNVKWNGVAILLSHAEACTIIGKPVTAIITALGMSGKPYAQAAGAIIKLQQSYIQQLNESSGGKGVRLFFNFYLGVITDVRRRGRKRSWGPSPCPVEEPVEPPITEEPGGIDETTERLIDATRWPVDDYVNIITEITNADGDPNDDTLVEETARRTGRIIWDPRDSRAIEARRREEYERRREP